IDLAFASPGGPSPSRATLAEVCRAWEMGNGVVRLLDGTYAPLPQDFLRAHGNVLQDILAARKAGGPKALGSSALRLDAARLLGTVGLPPPSSLQTLLAGLGDTDLLPAATLPAGTQVTLRDYQRRGVDWLTFLRHHRLSALLADDMGLGKTIQALCTFVGKTLVVAPTSVVHNWLQELQAFRPGLRVQIYHGPKRRLDPDADVVLTSYALLRLDVEVLASRLWQVVVLDEAHQIKNARSQLAVAACRLQADWRLALSGTPLENRLEELWSLMHFLHPGYLGTQDSFAKRWVAPIEHGDAAAAQSLSRRLQPFVLRRKKGDVVRELPPRTDILLRCELSEEERAAYDAVRAATQAKVVQQLQTGHNVMQALEALLRLRQACCHPALLPGRQHLAAQPSSKVRVLLENLSEVCSEGHRALVFSQWTGLLDLVEPHLRAAQLTFCRLDGHTADRGAVVRTFCAVDGPHVMLLSLKAGGVGLNLTAADHVFLLDPWWNPAVEDQAADRAHRIGQTRPVMVHRLIAAQTVEERIVELQAHKRGLAEAALAGSGAAPSLNREDILALLS
ncbi:MAG: DEAD/DEAH box helicase, partial [Deltaproteobacteria bacterium]